MLKKNKIKNKIISTTESLFKNNEYGDISIRQVASLSGISIGTFYRCINSKEELLELLNIKLNQKVYNDLLNLTKDKNSLEKIRIFFDTYINYITEYNYKFFSLFISLALENQNLIFSSKTLDLLKKYVKEAYENNDFNKNYSEEHILKSFSAFFLGIILNWCFSMGKSDIKNDFSPTFCILVDRFTLWICIIKYNNYIIRTKKGGKINC